MITHFQPFVEGWRLPLLWADDSRFLHDPWRMPCTVRFHHSRREKWYRLCQDKHADEPVWGL